MGGLANPLLSSQHEANRNQVTGKWFLVYIFCVYSNFCFDIVCAWYDFMHAMLLLFYRFLQVLKQEREYHRPLFLEARTM